MMIQRRNAREYCDESSLKELKLYLNRTVSSRRPLTVSSLAHYFGLQCDEYLRLSLTSTDQLKNHDTFKDSQTKQRGIQFESNIQSHYSSSILSDIHDENQFLSYLHSLIGSPSRSFSIGYNIKFRWSYDGSLQSNYKPDFLLIRHLNENENRIEITIADAKSSSRLRVEHCIQVALYAMDLRVWLERNQLDEQVFINEFGQIWLPSEDPSILFEKKVFPLSKLQDRLGHFLRHDLEKVLTGESKEFQMEKILYKILSGDEWMMLPRCALCSFASRCRQRAIYNEPQSINNLSYLSRSIHALIRSFFGSTDLSSMNIEFLHDPSRQSDDQKKLREIFLINPQDHSSRLIQAIETHEPQMKDQRSFLIPKMANDLLVLFLFLIPNPSRLHSLALFASNIYDMSKQRWLSSEPLIRTYPTAWDVVLLIGQSLDKLRENCSRPCQIVLFDENEKTNLFEQFTLASDSEHIHRCLTLLSSSENAILLDYPPDVIQTDRFYRSHPLAKISKEQIEEELFERYGSSNNNNDRLTKTELTQQLKQLNDKEQEQTRENLIGLPTLISLHTGQTYFIELANEVLFVFSYSSVVRYSHAWLFRFRRFKIFLSNFSFIIESE